jgi:hypothetical protein
MIQVGAYLQTYKNDGKTDFVLSNFRKHYPTSPIYLVSDNGDNFSEIANKYNCFYEHSKNNTGVSPLGWNKEQTFIWLDRFYKAHQYCQSEYILYLEDDVLIRSNNINFNNIDIAGVLENPIPSSILKYLSEKYKATFNTDKYGTGGGAIYKSEILINNYDKLITLINNEWTNLTNIHKSFGFVDMFMPLFYMTLNYKYTLNTNLIEGHRNSNWRNTKHPIIHGKDIYNYG